MTVFIADHFFEALAKAGLADDNTSRVILDFRCGHMVVAHIERFGDDKLLELVRTLEGAEIRREERPQHRQPCLSQPPPEERHGALFHDHSCMHDATDEYGTTLEHQCRCGKKWTTEPVGVSLVEPPVETAPEQRVRHLPHHKDTGGPTVAR